MNDINLIQITRISIALSIFTSLAGPLIAHAQERGMEMKLYGLGVIKRTDEEQKLMDLRRVKQVKPNDLAIQRKNEELRRQGRPLIDKSIAQRPENEIEMDTSAPSAKRMAMASTSTTSTAQSLATATAIPSSVDNSLLPSFPPIGNQGSLGSCVAWVYTYYMASHETCLARGCNNKTSNANVLSPSWTYNFLNRGQDGGSSDWDTMELLSRHGAPSIREVPYDGVDFRKWPLISATWRSALNNRTNGPQYITDFSSYTSPGFVNLKQLLANGHLAGFRTDLFRWNVDTVKADPTTPSPYIGQYAVTEVSGAKTGGWHNLTIVGYDDNLWLDVNKNGVVDAGERGAFKIANSWGTGWGNAGFMWLSYDAVFAASTVVSVPTSVNRIRAFDANEALTMTGRQQSTPRLVAEFTVNHAQRSQISLEVGTSLPTATIPAQMALNNVPKIQGGAFAFDGSTTAVDGTFVLDATELLPLTPRSMNYYLSMRDNLTGQPLTLKSLKLIDTVTNQEYLTSTPLPMLSDNQTRYAVVSYNNADNNLAPIANIQATTSLVGSVVNVAFDGSRSSDVDGSIVSYAWDFGDGSTVSTNSIVTHLYENAGTFQAKLTVTDNKGMTGVASYTVTVKAVDPVISDTVAPSIPTNFKATLQASNGSSTKKPNAVQLGWSPSTDNVGISGYEIYRNNVLLSTTGFTSYVDSSNVARGSYSYTAVARDAAGNRSQPSAPVTISR